MSIEYLHSRYVWGGVQQYHNGQRCRLRRREDLSLKRKERVGISPSINGVQSCLVPRSSISICGMVVKSNWTRPVKPFEQAIAKTLSPSSLTSWKCSLPCVDWRIFSTVRRSLSTHARTNVPDLNEISSIRLDSQWIYSRVFIDRFAFLLWMMMMITGDVGRCVLSRWTDGIGNFM